MFGIDWISLFNINTFGICSTCVTILLFCLFLLKVSTFRGIHTCSLSSLRQLSSLQFGSLLGLAHHHELLKEFVVPHWRVVQRHYSLDLGLTIFIIIFTRNKITQSQSIIHEYFFLQWSFNETESLWVNMVFLKISFKANKIKCGAVKT